MSRANNIPVLSLLLTVLICFQSAPADEVRIDIHPASTGPFPGGVGGQIPYSVSVEIADVESDGFDSQGIASMGWDLLTDTQIPQLPSGAALTGETGVYGPATVEMPRFLATDAPDEAFLGGYGFWADFALFRGIPVDDDLLGVGGWFPVWWDADVQPNAPGLQPFALSGIGIGERPAGGWWTLAEGVLTYPAQPGTYTLDLVPLDGSLILAGLDLGEDHASGWWEGLAPEDVIGDSFSFIVLPEPGAGLFLCIALTLCRWR